MKALTQFIVIVNFERLILCSFLLMAFCASGQNNYYFNISGPTSVCIDGTTTYTYTGVTSNMNWSVSGGTIVGSSQGEQVVVKWTSATNSLSATGGENDCYFYPDVIPPEYYCETTNYTSNPFSVTSVINTSYTLSAAAYCSGASTTSVTLSASQSGTSYQLKANGSPFDDPRTNSGGAITWTGVPVPGPYTVVANRTSPACTLTLPTSATASAITLPTVAASGTLAICSGTSTALSITNPNNQSGTTFSWTASALTQNVSGFSNGSGSTIAQTLTQIETTTGTVRYTITPTASGCTGSSLVKDVTVNMLPLIAYNGSLPLVMGAQTVLSTVSSYPAVQWKESGNVVSTTSTHQVIAAGSYTVTATTTSGAVCTSNPLSITTAFGDTGINVDGVSITRVFKEGVINSNSLYGLAPVEYSQVNQFIDGMGRVFQTISQGQSPLNRGDIVLHRAYGRDGYITTDYLPFVTAYASGNLRKNAIRNTSGAYADSDQQNFYEGTTKVAADNHPYARTKFRRDPGSRAIEQGAPGQDWQLGAHTVRSLATINTSNYPVRFWKSDGTTSSNYTSKSVAVAITTDENDNKVRTFTNSLGQTILKQVQLDETINSQMVNWLDTYYIYDEYGQLKYQVPPKAVAILDGNPNLETDTDLAELIFKYTYDARGRLVEKKEPGAIAKFMVYDSYDRLVLTQDGKLRELNKWAYVKYDEGGRSVYTGLYTNSRSRTSVQKWVDKAYTTTSSTYPEANYVEFKASGVDSLHGYSNVSFPKDSIFRLAVSYYDNYDFNATGSPPYTYDNSHITGLPTAASAIVRGMATGSKVRLLSATGNVTANWIKGAIFYDGYDRVIQTQSNNHLNLTAVDKSSVLYNNIRRVEKTKLTHNAQSVTTNITQWSEYDHAGRVLKTWHQVNTNTAVLAAQYEYNALGQLVDKKLHNTGGANFLQSVDYRYSIRGWLLSINNAQLSNDTGASNDDTGDYFGMELIYNTVVTGLSNSPSYNGNISALKWKGPGASGTANQRSYKYGYDKSDKLETATFQAHDGSGGSSPWTNETNTLDESMSYDHNGNMVSLARKRNNRSLGGTNTAATVDNLSYGYTTNTNILVSVQDTDTAGWFKNPVTTSSEYAHNVDGSLIRDDNKGISSITYNFLGKPQVVNFTGGTKVEYVYDAAGIKLTMKKWTGATLDAVTNYSGGFVYEGSTPAMSYFSSPEGRVVKNGSNFEYQYAIADHQGNTRVVFTSATPTPVSYTANMENSTNGDFSNYTNRVNFELYDHTDFSGSTYTYSQKLTGASGQQVGVAKSFKVYPGDKVKIEAYAKYMASSGSSNLTGFAAALLTAFGYSTPAGGETGTARAAVNSWGAVVAGGGGNGSGSNPKAFVNLLVVDKKYNFIDAAWDQINGGEQVGASPKTEHDYMVQEYTAREEGYIYVYVSNENSTLVEVYFDDVVVTHTPGNVVQANEYYPYGQQTTNSWTRQLATANNFLYNGGTELNKTTQLYDLYYRNYDPVLGRFGQVDPMASKYGTVSPYHFAGNNPVVLNDPLGDDYGDNNYLDSWYSHGVYRNAGSSYNSTDLELLFQGRDWYDLTNGRLLFADMLERRALTSTFINEEGKVLEHFDDGDFNIYFVKDAKKWDGKSKEGLIVVGSENPTHDYKKGETLQLWNPNHNLAALRLFSEDFRTDYLRELKKRRQWYGLQSVRAPGLLLGWAQLLGIRDTWFFEGFANPQSLPDINSASFKLGLLGLVTEGAEAKAVGKLSGAASTVMTYFEAMNERNGNLTTGDVSKIGIGVTTVVVPYAWVYGILDAIVGVSSGTSLTGRIGNGIDYSKDH